MTDLPPGWVETTLGEVLLRIEAGKSFRCEARPARPGEWAVIKVSAMTWGEFREGENKAVGQDVAIDPANEVQPGDILFSRANTESYVGASVLVGQCRSRLLLSDKSLRLVPASLVDPRWLAHLLSSPVVRREISRRATGTKDSMRNISQASLREIKISLPPLAEQRRIVATLENHLSHLQSSGTQIDAALKRARNLRARILHDHVTGAGDVWDRDTLGNLAESVRNGMYVSRPGMIPDGVPILRIGSVRALHLNENDFRYSGKSEEEVERAGYLLKAGDLLFTRYNGNPEYVGACALVPKGTGPLTYPDKLIRVRVDNSRVLPEYLALACSTGESRTAIRQSVKTTAGQAGISGRELKNIPINFPPLEMQKRIVRLFADSDQSLRRLEAQLASTSLKSTTLRRSLLTEAFAGRLVEQDPADEPASVLLERIRAERAAQGPVRRARRGKGKTAPQEETLV